MRHTPYDVHEQSGALTKGGALLCGLSELLRSWFWMRATQQLSPFSLCFKLELRVMHFNNFPNLSSFFFFFKHKCFAVPAPSEEKRSERFLMFVCLFIYLSLFYKNRGLSFIGVKPTVCVNLTALLLLLSSDILSNAHLPHGCLHESNTIPE